MIEWICIICGAGNEKSETCWKCGAARPTNTFAGPAPTTLPTRYHAALNEVEAHARTTARSILELLREFEKATGAEVSEVKLDRAYAYGVTPELKIVDLKLSPMPAARVRAGKDKGC